ncbi:MAG: electron transfer flavoprotein beta subunit [Actinomycetia bacterium]|nr:electron transfer flavoprotein beta subunit [Actinomycetes bacterium]
MRIAALLKQIPKFEAMVLGPDGRLVREGLELEMNPYCRRAVAQAVDLVSEHGGEATFFTLGPPSAEDSLREAVAWADARGVDSTGVLVTDIAFAGSDTLATSRALAGALQHEGPFDLVLVGRNSVDADTGQVGPELAELLDLPFGTGVRHLAIDGDLVNVRCEYDDGWVQAELHLPALLSTAERLCDPCKMDQDARDAVDAAKIRRLDAADLGPGPWGQAASPTWVGSTRLLEIERLRDLFPDAPVDEQVRRAVAMLADRGALDASLDDFTDLGSVPASRGIGFGDGAPAGHVIGVVVEPDRGSLTRELLGTAATLAADLDGSVVAISSEPLDPSLLGAWGADAIVELDGPAIEEDIARGVADWASALEPWAVLVPSTAWGREVASRAAARVGAGLTGDAVGLEVADDGRLTAWKPAFGGQLVAAITATSAIQMATVRAGVLPNLQPREHVAPVSKQRVESRNRVKILARTRDDDLDTLAEANVIVGVGTGVAPEDYPTLDPLLGLLAAELGATRKVTDKGWLPRARQIGITGRSVAPRLYVAVGLSGKFNHSVGYRSARTVLAINSKADALVFETADVGIVGDWREVLPLLVQEIERVTTAA